MEIKLDKVGRRYNHEWIFKNLTHTFESNSKTVILGSNGSGKSTLAQLIMGFITPSDGAIIYNSQNRITTENIYKFVSIASPYIDVFEDLTIEESIVFQNKLKPFNRALDTNKIILQTGLASNNKPIKYFSSGMKQRLKLALAIMSNSELLILDEPCSNLDAKSIDWYQALMEEYKNDRTIIVCSNNQEQEFNFCTDKLNVEDYKI